MIFQCARLKRGPAIDIKVVIAQDQFVIFPLWKRFQRIAAHNEREGFIRVFVAQVGEGVNRVGRLRQVEFNIGSLQQRIVANG